MTKDPRNDHKLNPRTVDKVNIAFKKFQRERVETMQGKVKCLKDMSPEKQQEMLNLYNK